MIQDPRHDFHTAEQLRLNDRRLEHLTACGLAPTQCRVLDVGAGLGDLAMYFHDRECQVSVTDGRALNVEMIKAGQTAAPTRRAAVIDLDSPPGPPPVPYEVVVCYSVLNLLERPAQAIGFLANCLSRRGGMLLLETPVLCAAGTHFHTKQAPDDRPTGSLHGVECHFTRHWVWEKLKACFSHTYIPELQVCHDEFPLSWDECRADRAQTARAVFVASHGSINNRLLSTRLLNRHRPG